MELFDTHCHIHSDKYELDQEVVIADGVAAGVTRFVCVGTDLEDSARAVGFVQDKSQAWASIGLHPHEARRYVDNKELLRKFRNITEQPKVVAIGEAGLDYYYEHSPKEQQLQLLAWQIELALERDLPMVFHIRDAFDDFWPVFDRYQGIRGVVHSFSASERELEETLARGLYVGLNGIMTFTRQPEQLQAAKKVPLERLLLETDAPFLTPKPYRGTICEIKHVRVTAEFLADLRGEKLDELATASTTNAKRLFEI